MSQSIIHKAVHDGHVDALLLTALAGLTLASAIPTPGDAFYFYHQGKWKRQLDNKEITPKTFWIKDAAGYYGYNFAWWLSIFGISLGLGKDAKSAVGIAVTMISAGAVIYIVSENIRKDKEAKVGKI